MRKLKAFLALPVLSALGQPARAQTQADNAAAATEVSAPLLSSPGEQDDRNDIVVTGHRPGEPEVATESEFTESEIAAQGADSIQDLLTRLAPFLGNGGGDPILLINGRPAGFDRSILTYPAEALNRLTVMKPEAAAVYGAEPGKRVVNLVLKPRFASFMLDMGVNWATGGGQWGNRLSIGRTAISGETRWNAQASLDRDGALLKSARAIARPAGSFDSVGYITRIKGGEIDPALSQAAGKITTLAAIPRVAGAQMPTIEDFVAGANQSHAADPNTFDTLLPSRRTVALDAGVTRPLGSLSLTLNFNAGSTWVRGLRGLPMASFVLPSGSPWSPFASDVLLVRPFSGERALRNDNKAESLGTSLTLTGAIAGWQGSFALSYLRNWTDNVLEQGIDVSHIEQLIDAGDRRFNPYGPWSERLLLATRSKAQGDTLSARLNLRKKIADLPAGPLAWSLVMDAGRSGYDRRQTDTMNMATTRSRVTFDQVNAQMSLAAPLSRRRPTGMGRLGDVGVDFWIGGQVMSRTSSQGRFGGGLHWSPIKAAQLHGAFEYSATPPSFDQLDAPLVRTVIRIFDYTRQEMAEPIWITGGNPNLRRGSRQTLSLSAQVQPFDDQSMMLNLNYRRTLAKGGSAGFPQLSPAVEAAFPDRVTRDASGQLVAVDARPISIAQDIDSDLLSGIILRFSSANHGTAGRTQVEPGNPIEFTLSLNHDWRLKSEMRIQPGLPPIDRLRGGTGTSRHLLNMQFGVGRRGIGASLNANWSSPARIAEGASNDALRIKPPTTLNVEAFAHLEQVFPRLRGSGLDNVRISLSVDNVLNDYSRVTRTDGTVPDGFSHDEIDPLGRTARIAFRKRF